MIVRVMSYDNGELLGTMQMDENKYYLYEEDAHPLFQWPEGIARAGHILSSEQIEKMKISPDTVIYLDD